jgi:hypothetical protein
VFFALISRGLGPTPRALARRFTTRQINGFREAVAYEAWEGRQFQWDLTRAVVAAQGGSLPEYPDYVPPEEGDLSPEAIERELDRRLASGAIRA